MTDNDTDAKARATAHALIQGYIGPDHKVIDMRRSSRHSCRR
jgi:hypothetical protein